MARLQAEGTVEGVHGLLPVAAPILFLADQEVVQRARRRQRGSQVPVLPRLLLSSELLQHVSDEVVSHRSRGRRALQLHQDGRGFWMADPDRQELVSFGRLEQHDRLLADQIEAHPVDLHLLHGPL